MHFFDPIYCELSVSVFTPTVLLLTCAQGGSRHICSRHLFNSTVDGFSNKWQCTVEVVVVGSDRIALIRSSALGAWIQLVRGRLAGGGEKKRR